MTQEANGSAEARADSPPKSENWSFIEPQPIREDQVQNAVKFLAHSKVKGSPIEHRRSFLERKGLSREEIDEAFRRVPDPPTGSRNDIVTSEGRYTVLPPSQAQSGALQQVVPAQQQPALQQIVGVAPPAMQQAQRKPRLLHFVLGVGFLTAVGAGTGVLFQRVLAPKLRAWIRAAASEDDVEQIKPLKLSPVEEAAHTAAAAANTAAIAAAEVASTYREMLKSRTEEWRHLTSIIKSLENHTQELKNALLSMGTLSQDMDGQKQMPPVANGNLEEHSQKASIKTSGGTASFLDQLQEVGQIQISNSVTKTERSNGNLGTFQTTSSSARVPGNEGWNQGSTSLVLQGKAAAYVNHASRINTVKDEPWWRNKKGEAENFTSSERPAESTVQITEIDGLQEGDSFVVENSFSTAGGGGTSGLSISGPSTQGWAPPPVPHTVMPGAAAAIRYRKIVTKDDSKSTLQEKVAPFQSSSGEFQEATAIEEESQSSMVETPEDAGQEGVLSEETKTYADVLKEET